MKNIFTTPTLLAALLLALPLCNAHAQGTAFTYQGRLNSSGTPVAGTYDFRFRLAGDPLANNYVGSPYLTNGVPVANGLFTTTMDFGPGSFTGSSLWLEVDVRTNGAGSYTMLNPLQALTPTPYAITAANLSGPIQLSLLAVPVLTNNSTGAVLSGTFSGNGAGLTNLPPRTGSTVGGGDFNMIDPSSSESFIGGGYENTIQVDSPLSTISGGLENIIQGNAQYSTIGGGFGNTIQTNAAFSVIGGGDLNNIQTNAYYSTISGGFINSIQAFANNSTISGGYENTIQLGAFDSTIGGGQNNTVQQFVGESTIGGGQNNMIQTNAELATIGGGAGNTCSGVYATIPGGTLNVATDSAFAAGTHAYATNEGAFVWADSQGPVFSSTADNQFLIRASGGVGIGTTSPSYPLSVENDASGADMISWRNSSYEIGRLGQSGSAGWLGLATSSGFPVQLRASGNSYFTGGNLGIGTTGPTHLLQVGSSSPAYCDGANWVNGSDRNAKQDFAVISPRTVLEKVSTMPITEWQYKQDKEPIKHIGPMAQDFYAAFGLNGTDDKHISTVDEGGVALAAIQGLNQKLTEELNRRDVENSELKQQNDSLSQRLNVLEQTVQSLTSKK